jgi:hypothetical protein
MAQWYTCTVDSVGPASNGTETPNPVIYLNLTDQAGAFSGQWFFAASNSRKEMLAVGLAAMSTSRAVTVLADPPAASGSPYTQVYRFYIR